jgi:hypothetical protein
VVSPGTFAAAISPALYLEVRVPFYLISSSQIFDRAESLQGVLPAAVANLSTFTLWANVDRIRIILGLDMGFFNSYSPDKSVQFLVKIIRT